jgi:hypothetical protein
MIEPNKHIILFSDDLIWLETRKILWAKEYDYSWADVDNLPYIQARCDYFFSGDLAAFIGSDQKPGLIEVILDSPEQELEAFITNISHYCEWVINSNITWGTTNKDNLNDRLFETIKAVVRENSYIPNKIVSELFTYFFGEKFEENREVTLTLSSGEKIFTSPISSNELSSMLRFYITRYMYEVPDDRSNNTFTSKYLIDFYFSIAEVIDQRVFNTTKIRKLEINGITLDSGSQRGLRYLIARMLGYITEYEEEDDIDEWFVNDAEFEAEFKKRWIEINWPPAYDKLVEFIHKHKGQCLFEND